MFNGARSKAENFYGSRLPYQLMSTKRYEIAGWIGTFGDRFTHNYPHIQSPSQQLSNREAWFTVFPRMVKSRFIQTNIALIGHAIRQTDTSKTMVVTSVSR